MSDMDDKKTPEKKKGEAEKEDEATAGPSQSSQNQKEDSNAFFIRKHTIIMQKYYPEAYAKAIEMLALWKERQLGDQQPKGQGPPEQRREKPVEEVKSTLDPIPGPSSAAGPSQPRGPSPKPEESFEDDKERGFNRGIKRNITVEVRKEVATPQPEERRHNRGLRLNIPVPEREEVPNVQPEDDKERGHNRGLRPNITVEVMGEGPITYQRHLRKQMEEAEAAVAEFSTPKVEETEAPRGMNRPVEPHRGPNDDDDDDDDEEEEAFRKLYERFKKINPKDDDDNDNDSDLIDLSF